MIWWILGGLVGLVALGALALFLFDLSEKKNAREALAARGRELGTWTVYYDVKQRRIGLVATFGESELLRYLVFRLHDLFDYNQGLEAERRRIGDLLIATARGTGGEQWQFLFNPPKGECYHAYDAPNGTLFKFFDGSLFEHAVSQPRFIGGDSIAKQQGLVGECVAIIHHLTRDPAQADRIGSAVARLVEKELATGTPGRGAKFWDLPNEALRSV